jgi:ribosome biogenesis GTPase A
MGHTPTTRLDNRLNTLWNEASSLRVNAKGKTSRSRTSGNERVRQHTDGPDTNTVGYNDVKIFDTPGYRNPSRDDSRQYNDRRCGRDARKRNPGQYRR